MRLFVRLIAIAVKAIHLLMLVLLIRWFGHEQTRCLLAGCRALRERAILVLGLRN